MRLWEHALFGNRGGSHQLLESSLVGEDVVLEQLRFLVDRPAGHIGPEVNWSPYWGCGSVRDWWVLWRGEEDADAPRKNMVRSHVVLVSHEHVGNLRDMEAIFHFLSAHTIQNLKAEATMVLHHLSRGVRPVVVPGLSKAPDLIATLWPYLWPTARQNFSLRTLFGPESLESGATPDVVIVPAELLPRWHGYTIIESESQKPHVKPKSSLSPAVQRLLQLNWERLPSGWDTLSRLSRIAEKVRGLREGPASTADALLVVRTVESFNEGLNLPGEDVQLLRDHLSDMTSATSGDIRATSLTKLAILGESVANVELAVATWIQENLPSADDQDALWILENQAGYRHEHWWLRAVRTGLALAFAEINSDWARAIWRWWMADPDSVLWIQTLLPSNHGAETALFMCLPDEVGEQTLKRIRSLSAERHWARLYAASLPKTMSLSEAVKVLCESVNEPESGLDVLLAQRTPGETVVAAAESGWPPLVRRALDWTLGDPALLEQVSHEAPALFPLLAAHLSAGGKLPSTMCKQELALRVFDGCIAGDENCCQIVQYLGDVAAITALVYARQEELWNALNSGIREQLLSDTAGAWLNEFAAGNQLEHPLPTLAKAVRERARVILRGSSMQRVIRLFEMFPEIPEGEFVEWIMSDEFVWAEHDGEQLGELLLARGWTFAARRCAWSRKNELKAAAWHARSLLNPFEAFWISGVGSGGVVSVEERPAKARGDMIKILFLASNPIPSGHLALDKEAREIEEQVRASKLRDQVVFRTRWAVRPTDLQQALLEEEPTVVHFSGHGTGSHGIALDSDNQLGVSLVPTEALVDLFRVLKKSIRVVVLNACYSKEQAAGIVKEIDIVVGMTDSIRDDAARGFAVAFYRALAYGQTIQTAFELGRNEMQLRGLTNEADVPKLLVRRGVDATTMTLLRRVST